MTKEKLKEFADNAKLYITDLEQTIVKERKSHELILPLLAGCDDTCEVSWGGGLPYVYVHNRDDLARMLSLAHKWDKAPSGKYMSYTTTVDPDGLAITVKIFAADNALPATCKVVEEEVVFEAIPERREMRKVVKCELKTS